MQLAHKDIKVWGYIGTPPASAALTSADLEDGIVTAAKIATDAVETVKVKDLNILHRETCGGRGY